MGRGNAVPCQVVLRTKLPVTVQTLHSKGQAFQGPEEEEVIGLKAFDCKIQGKTAIFSFTVPPGLENLAEPLAAERVTAVGEALQKVGANLNVAVVDSSLISGWEPKSKKWPRFRSNIKKIMNGVHAAGGIGYHLQASDLAGIQQKFEEIAELMEDTGLDEHL